jgi:hypothetical protein
VPIRAYIVAICLSCLIAGCETSTEWTIPNAQPLRLVVQAILTNELRTQEILLSTTYTDLNGASQPVEDAMIIVRAGGTTYRFQPDALTPGRYASEIAFAVVPQLQYELAIDWESIVYTASSVLSEVAPIPDILFNRVDTLGHFTVSDYVVPVYHQSQQAMYQIDLDWSHLEPQGQNVARLFYYTFSSLHISVFIRPEREDVIFPMGTIARITKYGLDDGFADYLRALVIETDWNGNWFYGNPENQPANLSGGAIGYFAACAVVKETIIVQ